MRIAYFSPLPPARSGIADYSAELLPYLGKHADVTLFVDPNDPVDAALAAAFPVHDAAAYARMHGRFDIGLYHMGNDAVGHEHVWQALQEYPGVVVVHEPLFYHFFQQRTVSRGDVRGFVRIIAQTYGDAAAQRVLDNIDDTVVNPVAFPLVEPVLSEAKGAIVHNQYAARQLVTRCPQVPTAVIPHHLSLPGPYFSGAGIVAEHDSVAIRRELGLGDALVVGTFGFLTEWKRIPIALKAFARLYASHPNAVYCLVGEVRLYDDLMELVAAAGLPPDVVRITGRTTLDEFLKYMVATDVAVNLRYPTAGETSGTLIRLLGLGVPVIVSDVGSFAEFPDHVCAKIPVDGFEKETLTATLLALVEDDALRRSLAANARAYIRANHTLEGSAQAYIGFIEQVLTGVVHPAHPASAVLEDQVLAGVAAVLAEWGTTEGDDRLLEPIARALAEIGLASDF
jgi:glycosyltransferase involved in cell wall biosynthesis